MNNQTPTSAPQHLAIHPTVQRNALGQFYMHNGLLNGANQVVLKRIYYDVHDDLNVCYQQGEKDGFMVIIQKVDRQTQKVNKEYKIPNNKLFTLLQEYAQFNDLTVNMRTVMSDVIEIYKHVNSEYIDNDFLQAGINELVKKYPIQYQPTVNAIYSHCVLAFTADFEYVRPDTGHTGALGCDLKLLGVVKMFTERMSANAAANDYRGKNQNTLMAQVKAAKRMLHQKGFNINVKH